MIGPAAAATPVEVARELATTLEAMRDYPGAIAALERLGADARLEDSVALAHLYRKAGRDADARALAARLAPAADTEPAVALDLVDLDLELGLIAEARRALDLAPPAVRAGARARELVAGLEARRGAHALAATLFAALAREFPERPELAWQAAGEHAAAGDHRAALALAGPLLAKAAPPELELVAGSALAVRDLDLAGRVVARLIPAHPTAPRVLLAAAVPRLRGDLPGARAVLERWAPRFPRDRELVRELADLRLELGEPEAALDAIAPSLAHATHADLAVAARAARAAGRWRDAQAYLDRYQRALPRSPDLAAVELLVGEREGARALAVLGRSAGAGTAAGRLLALRARVAAGTAGGEVAPELRALVPRLDPAGRLAAADLLHGLGDDAGAAEAMPDDVPPALAEARALLAARLAWRRTGDPEAVRRLLPARGLEAAELWHAIGDTAAARAALPDHHAAHERRPSAVAAAALKSRLTTGDAAGAVLAAAGEPEDPAARVELANAWLEHGDEAAAARLLDASWPDTERFRGELTAARAALGRGDRAAARGRLLLHAAAPPAGHGDRMDLAEALLEAGEGAEAARLLAGFAPLPALRVRHESLRARAERLAGAGPAARARVSALADTAACTPAERLEIARACVATGRVEPAARHLARLPAHWRATYDARKVAAQIALAREDAPALAALTRSLVSERPADLEAASLDVQRLLLERRPAEALAASDLLSARRPAREDLALGRAAALVALDRGAEALRITSARIAAADAAQLAVSAELRAAHARALVAADRPAEAVAHADALARLLPGEDGPERLRAAVLAADDRPAQALAALDRADARAEAPRATAATDRAALLAQDGRYHDARVMFASRLDAADPGARRAALSGTADLLAYRDATRAESLAFYRRLLAEDPRDPGRLAYAGALQQLGDLDAAEDELDSAERLDAGTPDQRALARAGWWTGAGRLDRAGDLLADLAERRPRWAEVHLARAEVAGARDTLPVIPLSPAGTRSWPYLEAQARAVRTAEELAPRRRAVRTAADRVFRPLGSVAYTHETGSDTLRRERAETSAAMLLDDRTELTAGSRRSRIERFEISERWVDAWLRGAWNPREGHALVGGATIGDAGGGGLDLLPWAEYRWVPERGPRAALSVGRQRVEDSPEAIAADLDATAWTLSAAQTFGRARLDAVATREFLEDGNTREIYTLGARVPVADRVYLVGDLEHRNSEFEPATFNLYFAPLRYEYRAAGFQIAPLYWGATELALGLQALSDELDGASGNGWTGHVRMLRRMGPLADLTAFASWLEQSATRRLGAATPYHQAVIQAAYNARF